MAFFAGKLGSVSIANVLKPLTDWSIDYKCDPIETTNFMDEGFASHIYGIKSADISANGPYNGTPGAMPGVGDHVEFSLGYGGASFVVTAVLTSVKIDLSVKDAAKISYTATSTGSFV